MPESTPFDDPFADLFEQLPDPRAPRVGTTDRAVGQTRVEPGASNGRGPTPPPPVRPLSRRAAREAATPSAPPTRALSPDGGGPQEAAPARGSDPIVESAATRTPDRDAARVPVSTVAATGSLDDLFSGTHSTEMLGSPPPPRDKRTRRIGAWIALVVVLALLGGAVVGGFWVWNTYQDNIRAFLGQEEPRDYEAGLATGEAIVTVSSGDTGGAISQTLFEAGVTKTSDAFYRMLVATGDNPTFYPGAYKLQKQMTSAAALTALMDPGNKLEDTAQLREGLTVAQTLPILADGTGIPLADLQTAVATPADYGVDAASLEGWLFPATYTFEPGVTAADVIRTLVNRTVQSLDAVNAPVTDRQRILTIASIIQREARFQDDFYKVSRVIENRMNPGNQETFGKLQMDSTAQYGYGEMHQGVVSSSAEALADDNLWNTYVHLGLPVGPISNPGDLAIDAAMHPAEGPWLYFVTVNLDTGETVFTSTYAEHSKAVVQWQSWCAEHPDSGC